MKLLIATTLLLTVTNSYANDVSFSIGGGYPYFVVPEVSLSTNEGNQRWYANYKIGLDDGFSIGVEHAISDNKKHAVGLVVGALGIQDNEDECRTDDESLSGSIGSIFGCALSEVFDEETTNGIGVSYSYLFRGLNEPGWRMRLDLGYGEGRDSNEKRPDAGITFSYQF
ncbi:hypothetical protein [Pseudoalteromonas sp. SaAl2]